jgi:hypothetical protein
MVNHASNASPANAANATQSRFSIAIASSSIQGLRDAPLLRPHTLLAHFGARSVFHPNSAADCFFYSRAPQRSAPLLRPHTLLAHFGARSVFHPNSGADDQDKKLEPVTASP